jgi:tetratricopeptide (TPR) repeat protein
MKSLFLKAAAAVAMLSAAGAPAHAEWLEAKSPHFTVIGDMSESELRHRTQQLEQYDGALRYLLGVKTTIPVTVFEVANIGDVQAAMGKGSRNIAGFYSATAQRAFAVVPEKLNFYQEDFSPRVVLFHEYAHHMLLSNTSVFMPGWAQEGLAEMFATAKIGEDGSVTIGDKNDARGDAMMTTHRWSVQRMLDSDLNPPKDKDEEGEKYSRGWALVHYLWMSGKRPGQYVEFIKQLNETVDPVASGKKVFGDLGKLDSELDVYLRAHSFNLSKFGPDKIGALPQVSIHSLSQGEAAILTYRIASAVGVDEKTAEPLAARARPVAAAYPNDLGVQVAMAEMEYDAKNYSAADQAADRALAKDPNNIYALVYKGRVGMRRAIEKHDAALATQARAWLLKANRADSEHPLPFVVYYDSFAAMGQLPSADATNGLFRAAVLVPQDTDLRIRASIALLRDGDIDTARRILAPAAFAAEGSGENKPLKLIKEMAKSKDKQALLAKAAELKLDQVNEFIEPPKDDDKDKS